MISNKKILCVWGKKQNVVDVENYLEFWKKHGWVIKEATEKDLNECGYVKAQPIYDIASSDMTPTYPNVIKRLTKIMALTDSRNLFKRDDLK